MATRTRRPHAGQKPLLGARLDESSALAQGLVAAWVLSEGGGGLLSDAAGQNPLAVQGNAPWGVGQRGSALQFTAAAQYASVGSPAGSALDLTHAFTFSAWVCLDSVPTTYAAIIAKWQDAGARSWHLGFGASGAVSPNVLLWTDGSATANALAGTSSTSAFVSRWRHIVGTWDGATKRVYVDGVQEASGAYGGTLYSNSLSVEMANHTSGTATLPGRVADTLVWNRALSAAEVASLYNDPYQMIAPQGTRLYVPTSSSGGSIAGTATDQAGGQGSATPTIADVATGQNAAQGALSPTLTDSATGQSGAQGTTTPTIADTATGQSGAQGALSPGISDTATGQDGASGATSPTLTDAATGQAGSQGSATGATSAPGAATNQAGAQGSVSPTLTDSAARGAGSQGNAAPTVADTTTGQSGAQGALTPRVSDIATSQAGGQGSAALLISDAATGQSGSQGAASGQSAAPGAATSAAGAQGVVTPTITGDPTGQSGASATTTPTVTDHTTGQAGAQGVASGASVGPLTVVWPPAFAVTWPPTAPSFSIVLGGNVEPIILIAGAQTVRPDDNAAPRSVQVNGLPPGATITAVTATATLTPLGSLVSQPAPVGFVPSVVPFSGNDVNLVVGNGANVAGGDYVVTLAIDVSGQTFSMDLDFTCVTE